MTKPAKYSLLGVAFWVIMDFTTTQAVKNPLGYYSIYMPALLFFYIGFPLAFASMIYRLGWSDWSLFIMTVIAVFVVEVLFTHNALMYTFPMMLLAIPVAIVMYSLLTFAPKWIVEKEIAANKWKLIFMIAVYILVSLATIAGDAGSA